MPIIDAHVHVWTPDTQAYPLAPGFTKENMKPPSFTPEQLLRHCQPEGVDRIVLIQMSFYQTDNRYMLDTMRAFPGTFGGVGIVDTQQARPDDDMGKLAKAGVRGFRITPKDQPPDAWLETPSFERMWKYAADHKLAVCPLINPEYLPAVSKMCAKNLNTRVVIDHFARIGIDGEIREKDLHQLCELAHFPQVRVKISAFYALGRKKPPHADLEPMIRRLHGAFGAKRLMWASDCPFAVDNERYVDSLGLVRDGCLWMKKDEKDWVLRKTAEEIFFS